MEEKILPCKCGKQAKVRYRMPYTWVECKKKCGMCTGFYCDVYEQNDPDSRREAIAEWNRRVKKSCYKAERGEEDG